MFLYHFFRFGSLYSHFAEPVGLIFQGNIEAVAILYNPSIIFGYIGRIDN